MTNSVGSYLQDLQQLVDLGRRDELVRVAKYLRSNNMATSRSLELELISRLCLGQEERAKKIYWKWHKKIDLSPLFSDCFKRYVNRSNNCDDIQNAISFTRNILKIRFKKSTDLPHYVEVMSKHSDIIIVSNNPSVKFSSLEKEKLFNMKNPLFIYLNIGNPVLCKDRSSFYNGNAREILFGGHHHVVDQNSRLFFVPYLESNFYGCVVRINNRFQELWYNNLLKCALRANKSVNFFELEELHLIDSLYPLSIIEDASKKIKKRIPSIGWLVISLVDAICSFSSERPIKLWLSGFTLSPSYIFEASNASALHDFPLEKEALDIRLGSGLMRTIGTSDSSCVPEKSTQQHLDLAGYRLKQLSRQLRDQKLI